MCACVRASPGLIGVATSVDQILTTANGLAYMLMGGGIDTHFLERRTTVTTTVLRFLLTYAHLGA